MTEASTTAAVDLFQKSWRVYQDIIEHNYMFHREISAACRTMLQNFQPGQRLRILDLGCGDASMVFPLLAPDRIAFYLGCDLSQPALDIADAALETEQIPHNLICDDMLRMAANQADASADIVFSSYAIHHLQSAQKECMLREIERVLAPGGRFVLIDIFREPSEDRAAYLNNYLSVLRSHWKQLAPEAMDLVIAHATTFDFPEHPDFYHAQTSKYGLAAGQCLTKQTWHEAWCYTKHIS